MKRSEVDKSKLSPMMLQYLKIKEQYEDTILFYRIGDFYEMFFEDAITASRELELTLTGKSAGLEERVPMCGVPHHAYQVYLDKLIDKGYKVAIVEQLEDPKDAKGMVDRGVIQVVTKGTRLDDSLASGDNNYVGNVYDFEYCYGISYCDISTGYFYAFVIDHDSNLLLKEIANRGIIELIVNSPVDRGVITTLRNLYNVVVTIRDDVYENDDYHFVYDDVSDVRIVTTIKHLLSYLFDTKKGELRHLQHVELVNEQNFLLFDVHTKKNLELTETIRTGDRTYSLLWLLDQTSSAMGSRFLKYNLENPLTDVKQIERRYDIIEKLLTEFILKDELREELKGVYDLERLSSRICYGNLNARDMIQLRNSLSHLPKIDEILKELQYDKSLEPLDNLYDLLSRAINDDAPQTLREGGLIKSGYNAELDELRSVSTGSKDFILQMEQQERERTGIKNLKVGYNKVFGYYIEVSKGSVPLIKEEFGYERKQTLTTGERFVTKWLKEKENIILGAEEKIVQLEYQLFMDIREKTKQYIHTIQKNAKILAEVDMMVSLATVASENGYVRPVITKERVVNIKDSRHPVVEKVNQQDYVPNDINMGKDTNILLITGPNMAGKSTYMRQFAIIVIMAQIGSFVPAKSCTMPIFDKIFTRIGASDDLVSGESTFMVEMKEANNAISSATQNSLILFDELGRGTATYDGMSIAQAILEYIHDKIKAKTLFSTHYHELTALAGELKNLRNVHVSAVEEDGKITFLHKIKNGAVDKSYGIHVASLANLPKTIIDRANDILDVYEHKNKDKPTFTQTSLFLPVDEEEEPTKESPVIEKIREIDPITMTPLDALNFLYEMKQEIIKSDEQKGD